MSALSFARERKASWPERMETVLHPNTEPAPADAPAIPGPVSSLGKLLAANGWEVRYGYSRAYRRGQRTGTFRIMDAWGVQAANNADTPYRVVGYYWRFADKTEEFSWFEDRGLLERTEKACGTPGSWTWSDPRIVQGANRHHVKVTDVKEFAKVRGSVLPGWFAGIARRIAEQAAKALCGDLDEHLSHTWETTTGITKFCSGKATKPKESEAS